MDTRPPPAHRTPTSEPRRVRPTCWSSRFEVRHPGLRAQMPGRHCSGSTERQLCTSRSPTCSKTLVGLGVADGSDPLVAKLGPELVGRWWKVRVDEAAHRESVNAGEHVGNE